MDLRCAIGLGAAWLVIGCGSSPSGPLFSSGDHPDASLGSASGGKAESGSGGATLGGAGGSKPGAGGAAGTKASGGMSAGTGGVAAGGRAGGGMPSGGASSADGGAEDAGTAGGTVGSGGAPSTGGRKGTGGSGAGGRGTGGLGTGGSRPDDAGSTATPGTVVCGISICRVGDALSSACCVSALAAATVCIPTLGTGCANAGTIVACDDAADCGMGRVCCADQSGNTPIAACADHCMGGSEQLCRTDEECRNRGICRPSQPGSAYSVCR